MVAKRFARAFALAFFTVCVACLGLGAGVAFASEAVDVWGAQAALSQEDLSGDTVEVDMLVFSGEPGDAVFLTVKDGGKAIATNLAHKVGDVQGSAQGGAGATDVFKLEAPQKSLEAKLKAGSYSVEVAKTRKGKTSYSASMWGVYAHLKDGDNTTEKLIGAVTGASAFTAPDKLYEGGKSYKLASANPQTASGKGVLAFEYEPYDENTSVDGVIKYVDRGGNLLSSTTIAGIPYDVDGAGITREIPTAITANGKVYRTLYHTASVTAKNPGQSAFVVPCVAISDDAANASGHYVAQINLVAGKEVIATDTVNVTGTYYYNAPSVIYKSKEVEAAKEDGGKPEEQVATYHIVGKTMQVLEPSTDPDMVDLATRTRVVNIEYTADALQPAKVEVTFNLLNGQERAQAGNKARSLGTKKATVNAKNPTAAPDAQITVDGTVYKLAGSADAYQYIYGSGEAPLVNAYYVPEGYTAPGSYDVTVNYVNLADNSLIASETFTSSPDDLSDVSFTAPEQFAEGGATYVRLPGQEAGIQHNYWSNTSTYTVYYRNSTDTLTSGSVISRVRVVYDDVPGTNTNGNANGTGTAGANANGAAAGTGANAAGADAANPGQLNQNGTYNVLDGTGNQTLTNEGGVDSNEERIADDETPLANFGDQDGAGEGLAGATVAGIPAWALGLLAALVVAGGIVWFVVARRRENDAQ